MSTQTQATEPATETTDLIDAAVRETEARLMATPELMQMKMENESIMTECRLRPRDMEAIKRELTKQLEAFPELAAAAIYSKPVGEGKNASGLSIKAAETLAEVYGYNRVQTAVSPLDANSVYVEATFIDYQNGRVWRTKGILSKFYTKAKNKGGGQSRIPEDRFNSVTVKAEASRQAREAITRCINSGLKAWFENECRKRQQQMLTPGKVAEIVESFRDKGVTLEQLDTLIGRPKSMGWTNADKALLANTWNAIKDGETTIDQVIADRKPDNVNTLDDLTDKLTPDPSKPKPVPETADTRAIKEAEKRFANAKRPNDIDGILADFDSRADLTNQTQQFIRQSAEHWRSQMSEQPEPEQQSLLEDEPVDEAKNSENLGAHLLGRIRRVRSGDAVDKIETEAEALAGDGQLFPADLIAVKAACVERKAALANQRN